MNFVCIDIGASGTRFMEDKANIALIPNNAVQLPTEGEYTPTKLVPYGSETESALEVHIEKVGESNIFPLNFLYGQMAERYSATNERPSVQMSKSDQAINYASMLTAIAVSRLDLGTPAEISLYVAVPPVEVEKAQEAFNNEMVGKFKVVLPKYKEVGATVNINITDVNVYAEAHMSTASFYFNLQGQLNTNAQKYLSGNVLCINIGASTTDMAVVVNGKYMDSTGQTFPIGGNEARDLLIDYVNEKYGFELPISEAETAMKEGRVPYGSGYEEIGDLVARAKDELAKMIIQKMEYYFKKINKPIQTFKAIIVAGGGSLQSQYTNEVGEVIKTSEPMSSFVTEKTKKWCETVEVVPYGAEARLADVKGLYVTASYEKMKREKEEKLRAEAEAKAKVQTGVEV